MGVVYPGGAHVKAITMNKENWLLVTDEALEFENQPIKVQDFKNPWNLHWIDKEKPGDHTIMQPVGRGRTNQLGSHQSVMLKNLPGH
jgi:hypothetical protein